MFDATTESESSIMEQLEDPAAGTDHEEPSENEDSQEEQSTEPDEETVDQEETDSEEEQSDDLEGTPFKSTADLLKSYRELQRKYTQERQQAKQPQPQPRQEAETESNNLYDAFDRDPLGTIERLVEERLEQRLNQALAPINQDREVQSLTTNLDPIAKEYTQLHTDDGVTALFDKVREIAEEVGNPNLIRNPSQRILKLAAGELWGNESKAKVYQQAKELGRKQAEEARRQKQGVAVAVTKKPNEAPKTEADAIVDGIFSAGQSGGLFG